jgi:hypothetical protein
MTAVQQVFSDLLALHPKLFNINSVEGREFVHHFHKYLAVEKEQIENAFNYGQFDLGMEADEYYNQTFKSE